jgi:hypothetical protein
LGLIRRVEAVSEEQGIDGEHGVSCWWHALS